MHARTSTGQQGAATYVFHGVCPLRMQVCASVNLTRVGHSKCKCRMRCWIGTLQLGQGMGMYAGVTGHSIA